MARIVVGSYMVRYPLGGMRSHGPGSCFDPERGVMSDDCSFGTRAVGELLATCGLPGRGCFVDETGRYHGMDRRALLWSTFVVGDSWDPARDLALHGDGAVTFAGETWSPNFPVSPGTYDTSHNGQGDAFVFRLDATGTASARGTFLGEAQYDYVRRMALDPALGAHVGGEVWSSTVPVTPGTWDQSVSAQPRAGRPFGFAGVGAPPAAPGVQLLGLAPYAGLPFLGITLLIDVTPPMLQIGVQAHAQTGGFLLPLVLPPTTGGGQVFAQAVWLDTGSCGAPGTLSASDALRIMVQ